MKDIILHQNEFAGMLETKMIGIKNVINIRNILVLFLILYVYFIFLGYGSDDDIYWVLNRWDFFKDTYNYWPSRNEGHLIPEMIIGITSDMGGYYFSNLISLILGMSFLLIFYKLLQGWVSDFERNLVVLSVGFNPYWIIACTSSMDYVYALFFFIFGIYLLVDRQKYLLAGIIFALAVSSRITYGPLICFVYLFCSFFRRKKQATLVDNFKTLGVSFIIFIMFVICLYLPLLFYSRTRTDAYLFDILTTQMSTFGYVARFIYKNIYFWGLPAFLVVLMAITMKFATIKKLYQEFTRLEKYIFWGLIIALIYSEVMFLRFPIETSYLLPILFFAIPLFAILKCKKVFYYLFIVSSIFYAFINIDIAQFEYAKNTGARSAIGGKMGLYIRKGVLLKDINDRIAEYKRIKGMIKQK